MSKLFCDRCNQIPRFPQKIVNTPEFYGHEACPERVSQLENEVEYWNKLYKRERSRQVIQDSSSVEVHPQAGNGVASTVTPGSTKAEGTVALEVAPPAARDYGESTRPSAPTQSDSVTQSEDVGASVSTANLDTREGGSVMCRRCGKVGWNLCTDCFAKELQEPAIQEQQVSPEPNSQGIGRVAQNQSPSLEGREQARAGGRLGVFNPPSSEISPTKSDYSPKESAAAATNMVFNCDRVHKNCVRNECGLARNYLKLYAESTRAEHKENCIGKDKGCGCRQCYLDSYNDKERRGEG